MKKKILYILLIILITLLFNMLLINNSYAAGATISVPNDVKKGSSYTVTVNIPSNAIGYTGIIKVTYSDGQTDSSGLLTKLTGMDGNSYSHPGNMSATFTAKAAGNATITLEKLEILDAYANTISAETVKGFPIAEPSQTQPPTQPQTPDSNTNTNTTPPTTQTVKFTDVNETVYTTERCNIRESYSTSSNKIATVNKDTKLTRKGIGDNGWSKVEYNGKTCYISSKYLNKDKPADPEFKEVNEKMYAKQSCNLRASWTTDSDKVGYLDEGQEVTRVGVADNGWSKIKYNGSEVYVATRLLQTEPIEEKEPEESEEEPEENDTEEPENTTNDEALAEIKNEIGVLPEVGNNIAVYIYAMLAIIALIGAGYGVYYTNKK